MKATKKWISLLLSALLLFGLGATSLASNYEGHASRLFEAYADGREISASLSVDWKNPMMVDAETNALLSSVFADLELLTTYGMADETTHYATFALALSGQEAVRFSSMDDEDSMYFGATTMPSVLKVDYADIPTLWANYMAYMNEMSGGYVDSSTIAMQDAMTEIMNSMYSEDVTVEFTPYPSDYEWDEDTAADAWIDSMDIADVVEAIEAWTEEEMAGEPYPLPLISMSGTRPHESVMYELTKDKVIALYELVLPLLKDNEAYWNTIKSVFESMNTVLDSEVADIPGEDLGKQLDTMLESLQAIPDDLSLCYIQGLDKNGEVVLNVIDGIIPSDSSYSGDFTIFSEWTPGSTNFYLEMGDETGGFTLKVTPQDRTSKGFVDEGFKAVFTPIGYDGEPEGALVISTNSVSYQQDDTTVWDGGMTFSLDTGYGMTMGLEFIAHNTGTDDGTDLRKETTLDVAVLMDGAQMPILTLNGTIETGELSDLPFDLEALEEGPVDLGKMSEEEFAAFFENDVMYAALRSILAVGSLLPDEVMQVLMEAM